MFAWTPQRGERSVIPQADNALSSSRPLKRQRLEETPAHRIEVISKFDPAVLAHVVDDLKTTAGGTSKYLWIAAKGHIFLARAPNPALTTISTLVTLNKLSIPHWRRQQCFAVVHDDESVIVVTEDKRVFLFGSNAFTRSDGTARSPAAEATLDTQHRVIGACAAGPFSRAAILDEAGNLFVVQGDSHSISIVPATRQKQAAVSLVDTFRSFIGRGDDQSSPESVGRGIAVFYAGGDRVAVVASTAVEVWRCGGTGPQRAKTVLSTAELLRSRALRASVISAGATERASVLASRDSAHCTAVLIVSRTEEEDFDGEVPRDENETAAVPITLGDTGAYAAGDTISVRGSGAKCAVAAGLVVFGDSGYVCGTDSSELTWRSRSDSLYGAMWLGERERLVFSRLHGGIVVTSRGAAPPVPLFRGLGAGEERASVRRHADPAEDADAAAVLLQRAAAIAAQAADHSIPASARSCVERVVSAGDAIALAGITRASAAILDAPPGANLHWGERGAGADRASSTTAASMMIRSDLATKRTHHAALLRLAAAARGLLAAGDAARALVRDAGLLAAAEQLRCETEAAAAEHSGNAYARARSEHDGAAPPPTTTTPPARAVIAALVRETLGARGASTGAADAPVEAFFGAASRVAEALRFCARAAAAAAAETAGGSERAAFTIAAARYAAALLAGAERGESEAARVLGARAGATWRVQDDVRAAAAEHADAAAHAGASAALVGALVRAELAAGAHGAPERVDVVAQCAPDGPVRAIAIAEEFRVFATLVAHCVAQPDPERSAALTRKYAERFSEDGFVEFFVQWCMEHGEPRRIFELPESCNERVAEHFRSLPDVLWLQLLRMQRYSDAAEQMMRSVEGVAHEDAETLASLAKLSLLAEGNRDNATGDALRSVESLLFVLETQKRLPPPKDEDAAANENGASALSSVDLVRAYTSESALRSEMGSTYAALALEVCVNSKLERSEKQQNDLLRHIWTSILSAEREQMGALHDAWEKGGVPDDELGRSVRSLAVFKAAHSARYLGYSLSGAELAEVAGEIDLESGALAIATHALQAAAS